MFLSHWGLKESPFRGGIDPRYFFPGPSHEEALARLHFLADERRAVGLVLGASGLGKSLLLEVFARQLRSSGRQVAKVNLVGLCAQELIWQLAAQLGANPTGQQSLGQLWHTLTDKLVEHRYQQLSTIILLDDADEASAEVIDHATRLSQLDQSPNSRLTMVLACQPQRLRRLGLRMLELAELRIDIDVWDEFDTKAFLELALAEAGRAALTFTDDAIEALHRLAGGVPRRVKQLAELALLAGAGSQVASIDLDTIEGVYRELGVVTAGSFS